MESLAEILSGAGDESAASETTSTAATPTTTDVKTVTPAAEKPAKETAAAPSAAKTPEEQPAAKTDEPAEKAGEAETPEQVAERTRNEKGQFAKTDDVTALRKGLAEERRKRQEAERERDEAKKPKEAETPKKDFLEDPEGAFQERLTPIQQKYESELFELREELVRAKHEDYDEVVNELMEEAKGDRAFAAQLASQFEAAGRKPQFLYTYAMNRREMKAVGGDLAKYKESVGAEFKTKITTLEGENKSLKDENAKLKAQLENLSKVPESLNSQASATRAKVETEAVEREPLEDIFKPRKRRSA